jgi:hypothetical protein
MLSPVLPKGIHRGSDAPTGRYGYRQRNGCRYGCARGRVFYAAGGDDLQTTRPYRVSIKQPLGIVLAEDAKNRRIVVEEVVPGGNADQEGSVQVGDVLSGCSGVTLKEAKLSGSFEKEGYGQRPYDNWEVIWVDCEGLKYETVMAALKSNNPRWGISTITLELKRSSAE